MAVWPDSYANPPATTTRRPSTTSSTGTSQATTEDYSWAWTDPAPSEPPTGGSAPAPTAPPTGGAVTPTGQVNPNYTGQVTWPQLQSWYQTYLKRDPALEDWASHSGNPGGASGVLGTILMSPEYQALQSSLQSNQASAGSGSYGAVLPGWDATKWADTSHTTPKYTVGRILSNYPPTIEGLKQALPAIQQAFPGTTWDGKDKLTIPGVGTFDVLIGASQGGTGWAWQDLAGGGGGGGAGGYGLSGITNEFAFPFPQPPTIPPYTPGSVPSYTGPDRNTETDALIESLGGWTKNDLYGDAYVAAMNERLKEQGLAMNAQQDAERGEGFASRGTYGSGAQLAGDRRSDDALVNSLLGGYRDTELFRTGANREARMNAAQALNEALNSEQGRYSDDYRARLAGALAQLEENRYAWESNQVPFRMALDLALAGNQTALEYLRFLEGQRQFDDSMGFNMGVFNAGYYPPLLG